MSVKSVVMPVNKNIEKKSCRICKIEKNKNLFDNNRKVCKECRSEMNSQYYLKNKEKWKGKSA